jgi:hypothetical protein
MSAPIMVQAWRRLTPGTREGARAYHYGHWTRLLKWPVAYYPILNVQVLLSWAGPAGTVLCVRDLRTTAGPSPIEKHRRAAPQIRPKELELSSCGGCERPDKLG